MDDAVDNERSSKPSGSVVATVVPGTIRPPPPSSGKEPGGLSQEVARRVPPTAASAVATPASTSADSSDFASNKKKKKKKDKERRSSSGTKKEKKKTPEDDSESASASAREKPKWTLYYGRLNDLIEEHEEVLKSLKEEQKSLLAAGKGEEDEILVTTSTKANEQHQQHNQGTSELLSSPDLPMQAAPSPLKQTLPRDTFSFLIFVRWCPLPSTSLLYAISVWGIQLVTYVLVFWNSINLKSGNSNNSNFLETLFDGNSNVLNVPVNVDASTRIGQGVAIIVTAVTQEDIRTALLLIRDGHTDESFAPFVGSNKAKWLVSIFARFLTGFLGIVVTFLLIVESDEVRDLLLNFTAVEFVANLDDTAFWLAKHGFFWKSVKQATTVVESTSYGEKKSVGIVTKKKHWFRNFLFVFVLFVLLAGWGIIWHKQHKGKYNHQEVFVKMNDFELHPHLVAFSGRYEFKAASDFFGRIISSGGGGSDVGPVVYFRTFKGVDGEGHKSKFHAFFAYCRREETWTFTFDGTNPCKDWVVKASSVNVSPSGPFDIFAYEATSWLVRRKGSKNNDGDGDDDMTVTMNRFELSTSEFSSLTHDEDDSGCDTLVVAAMNGIQAGSFLGFGHNLYRQLKDITVNRRKVFFGSGADSSRDEILVFNGYRWVLITLDTIDAACSRNSKCSPKDLLADDKFHFYWSNYEVSFISDPAGEFADAPTEQLKWYKPLPRNPKFTPNRYGDLDYTLRCCSGICKDDVTARVVCGNNSTLFRLKLTTDDYPEESSWTLDVDGFSSLTEVNRYIQDTNDALMLLAAELEEGAGSIHHTTVSSGSSNSTVRLSGGPYNVSRETNVLDLCIPDASCSKFSFLDNGDDGIFFPGEWIFNYGNDNTAVKSDESSSSLVESKTYKSEFSSCKLNFGKACDFGDYKASVSELDCRVIDLGSAGSGIDYHVTVAISMITMGSILILY